MATSCSGQSNAALFLRNTYSYEDVAAEAATGALDAVRYFQFGNMGLQHPAAAPAYATTALTYPAWPWQNLSTALAARGFAELGNAPAACLYFLLSLKRAGHQGPLGMITNAVGGTTLAAWADASVLDACVNATSTASAAPPTTLFNGQAAPLFNTSIAGWIYCE